jgi:hypothetical protein
MNQRIFAVGMSDTHPNPTVRAAAAIAKHSERARAARAEMARMMGAADDTGAPAAPTSEETPPLPAPILAWLRGVDDAVRESFAKNMKIPLPTLLDMLGPAPAEDPTAASQGPPSKGIEDRDRESIERAAGTHRTSAPTRAYRDASGNYVHPVTPSEARRIIAERAAAQRGGGR